MPSPEDVELALAAARELSSATTKVASFIGKGVASVAAGVNIKNTVASRPVTGSNIYTDNNLTVFPFDIPKINGTTYCLALQFYRYVRSSILVKPSLTPFGMIGLPLPSDMTSKDTQSYTESSSKTAVAAGLESAKSLDFSSFQNLISNLGNVAIQGGTEFGFNTLNSAATSFGDSSSLSRALQFGGVQTNPFLSLIYEGPTYRRFSYSWNCIPETAKDTENLNYILNKFRYHSYPDINPSTGGLLLTIPDLVHPTFLPEGYLYDHKLCAIENFTVDYAPSDSPSFHSQGAPSAIRVTLNLIEVEYWLKSNLATASNGLTPLPSQLGYYGSAA